MAWWVCAWGGWDVYDRYGGRIIGLGKEVDQERSQSGNWEMVDPTAER